jgi:hypothetical protein
MGGQGRKGSPTYGRRLNSDADNVNMASMEVRRARARARNATTVALLVLARARVELFRRRPPWFGMRGNRKADADGVCEAGL